MNIKKILFFLLMLKNLNKIYAGGIKEEKSFDEIFGQRWDEKEEENEENESDQNGIIFREMDDQNEAKKGENIQQNIFNEQINQIFDENLEVKDEEKSEKTSTNYEDEFEQMSENNGQISDHFSSEIEKKKREIVEKFHKIKEKFKQMGKQYSNKGWHKIERKIAQKLGVNQRKIYEWKREFGLIIKNSYSDEEKHKILKQFDQIYGKIKMKLNEKINGKREKCQKIIAKHLGISLISIYRWKKQFISEKSVKNQKIDCEKREIVEKYFKTKNEFMQMGKHSRKEWKEFNGKVKQIFGVNFNTIDGWTEKLGIKQNAKKERKILTIAEKMEKTKQYYQMKKQNPKLTDREIATKLEIPISSLYKCKSELMGDAKKF